MNTLLKEGKTWQVTWCLMVSYKNNSILTARKNEWLYRVWMDGTPKKLYKTRLIQWLRKSLTQGDQKSVHESWIWRKILVGIMNHWGKKRHESWISKFKWFRFFPRYRSIVWTDKLEILNTCYICRVISDPTYWFTSRNCKLLFFHSKHLFPSLLHV